MSRRQPRKLLEQQAAVIGHGSFPGWWGGRSDLVRQTGQLGPALAQARGIGGAGGFSQVRGSKIDVITLPEEGPVSVALTYMPIPGSINVSINGLAQAPDTGPDENPNPDWEVSGQVLTLKRGYPHTDSGDVVAVQYDYLLGQPLPHATPEPEIVLTHATSSGIFARFPYYAFAEFMEAGDWLFCLISCNPVTPPGGNPSDTMLASSPGHALFAYQYDGAYEFDFIGQNDVRLTAVVVRGVTSIADWDFATITGTSSPGPTAFSPGGSVFHLVTSRSESSPSLTDPTGVSVLKKVSDGTVANNGAVAYESRGSGLTVPRIWTTGASNTIWAQAVVTVNT